FGLDIVEAGHAELTREVIPFLMVAGDFLAPEHHSLLEPPAQPADEGRPLVAPVLEEVEQLSLEIEIRQRRAAEQPNQVVAVERAIDAIFEVLLARRE